MRSGLSTVHSGLSTVQRRQLNEPVKISIAGAPAASDLFRARRRHPQVFTSKAKRRCPVAVGDNAKWRPRVGGAGRYSPKCRLSESWQCVACTAMLANLEPGWALICVDEQCCLPALLSCVCVKFRGRCPAAREKRVRRVLRGGDRLTPDHPGSRRSGPRAAGPEEPSKDSFGAGAFGRGRR